MGAFVNGKWLSGTETHLNFVGQDDEEYRIEFRVTSWGSGASWSHPGDPVEWEWDKVFHSRQDGTEVELTEESLAKLGIDPDKVIMDKWNPGMYEPDYPDE